MPHPILSTTIAAYLLMLSATWINAEPPSVAKWSIGEPIVTYGIIGLTLVVFLLQQITRKVDWYRLQAG